MKLNTANEQGVTRRQNLEFSIKQMKKAGKTDAELKKLSSELEPVKLEPGTERLIYIFNELDRTRPITQTGTPLAVQFAEIKAYAELMAEDFSPWEVGTLKAMDNAYLQENYSKK